VTSTEVWSKADIHIHSDHSDGLASIPAIMEYVREHTDLSVIAITDHNAIEGGRFALSLRDMYDVDVIVGEEVSSREGHVLGLFLEELVPPRMSAADTVRAIKEQGGIAIIPHPFSAQGVFGARRRSAFEQASADWGFDGYEVFNSLPYLGFANNRAEQVAPDDLGIAVTGGSDAHVLRAIGLACTMFRGTTAEDLRRAIEARETRASAEKGGLGLLLRYMLRYPQIRRLQSWNWERCKTGRS
jgi:predicted metal-dependent phosphoesterase TrpH